jgi:hypothetical protein
VHDFHCYNVSESIKSLPLREEDQSEIMPTSTIDSKARFLFSSDMVTSHNVQVATYQQLHYGCPLRGQFTVSRTRKMFSPVYIVCPTTHRDCLLLDCKVQNKILFSLLTYFPLLPLPNPFLVFFFFLCPDSESKV